jgi:hypothetical protein
MLWLVWHDFILPRQRHGSVGVEPFENIEFGVPIADTAFSNAALRIEKRDVLAITPSCLAPQI